MQAAPKVGSVRYGKMFSADRSLITLPQGGVEALRVFPAEEVFASITLPADPGHQAEVRRV